MTQEEAVKKISEWANASYAYLSSREGYPLGYRNGIAQAKNIILNILSQIDAPQEKSEQEKEIT